jgi:hypothetical protein
MVPSDVAEPAIDFAIKADLVPHAYSNNVRGTIFSTPFRVLIQDPLSLTMDAASLSLAAAQPGKVRGKIVRNPAYKQNVRVALAGLPAGYSAPAVTISADKSDFEIAVTSAAEPTARVLPNVTVDVALANGKRVITQPIELKVAPAKK